MPMSYPPSKARGHPDTCAPSSCSQAVSNGHHEKGQPTAPEFHPLSARFDGDFKLGQHRIR